MAGDIGVDSALLARAGGRLTEEAKAIVTALEDLRKVLETQGSAWGGDEMGTRFARAYGAFATQAFTSISTYGDQVDHGGTGHADGARCWVELEQLNRDDAGTPGAGQPR